MSDSNLTEAQREQVARAKQAAEELAAEKSGIPDVLKPLIETHEEDGSPVGVCDPGCRQAYVSGSVWEGYFSGAYLPTMTHCPACGIHLGFTDDGRPYRIRHSRVVAELDQAQAERDRYIRTLLRVPAKHLPSCPAQVLDGVKVVEGDYCRDCPHRPDNVEYTGKDCWAVWQARVRGADAATEEAPDEPVDAGDRTERARRGCPARVAGAAE